MFLVIASFIGLGLSLLACYYFRLDTLRPFIPRVIRGQQANFAGHRKLNMFVRNRSSQSYIFIFFLTILLLSGCSSIVKKADTTPTLLKSEDATHAQLMA